MNNWDSSQHKILFRETKRSCKKFLSEARRDNSKDQRAGTYTILFLHGKFCSVVPWITDRDRGGGGGISVTGLLIKDGEDGDKGVQMQLSRGAPSVGIKPRQLCVHITQHYGGNRKVGGMSALCRGRTRVDGCSKSSALSSLLQLDQC